MTLMIKFYLQLVFQAYLGSYLIIMDYGQTNDQLSTLEVSKSLF